MFRPVVYIIILSFTFDSLEIFLCVEFSKCCYHKYTFDFCFWPSLLCDGNSEIPEWVHSFKFLNFDVNFLFFRRFFHCLVSGLLFDQQSTGGSFVVKSSNQIGILYKIKIIDLFPLADNFVFKHFKLRFSRKIWIQVLLGEISHLSVSRDEIWCICLCDWRNFYLIYWCSWHKIFEIYFCYSVFLRT